jgi:PAS domain S-box-containing protein
MTNNNASSPVVPLASLRAPRPARFFWLVAAASLCFAAAAFVTAMLYVVLPAQREHLAAEARVDHTQQVLTAIDRIMLHAADAESGERGFLLTEDSGYLVPYSRAVDSIRRRVSDLQRLTADNPDQQRRLKILQDQIEARLARLTHQIDLVSSGHAEAAVKDVREGEGQVLMDSVRATAADMTAEEQGLLLSRRAEEHTSFRRGIRIALFLTMFGGVSVLVGGGATAAAFQAARARSRLEATTANHLRLLNTLDLAPILIHDLNGHIIFWSEGCRRLYGWSAEQAIGQQVTDLLTGVFTESLASIVGELERNGEWSGELRRRRRDGTELILLAHKFRDESIAGQRISIVETVADVTQLRKFEAILRASEARLNLFIENAPASIAMFDNEMRYLAVSNRFLVDYQLTTLDRSSLIGRSHYEIFPEIPENWRDIHRRVLAGERHSSDAEPFHRADGTVNWVRWEMEPWRNADGTIGGALLSSEDMTARIEAEAALRDNEARLRLVQQVAGIAYTDRVLSENKMKISEEYTQIYGLPRERAWITREEGMSMVHPDDLPRLDAMLPSITQGIGKFAADYRIIRPDGAVRWVSMQAASIPGPAGAPTRIITALLDCTEIVAASQALAARSAELERSNAELEQFADTVAHDLKAPLRAIRHLAEWIADDMKATASVETVDNLQLLQARALRMQALLDGLLKYAKAGQIDKTVEEIAVADLVSHIITMVAPPPAFVITYSGDGLRLITHPIALQIVLENLIGNALKHHDRAQGKITISARRVDGVVEIRVSDDGLGIPEEFHQRVFGIFQTLRSRDEHEASGMGLAIVKKKVEGHGGRIWIESAPPARGTTFVFTWEESSM